MTKTDAIYVKVNISYGEPTEFDNIGCDGMFIESTEICTKEFKQIKADNETLRKIKRLARLYLEHGEPELADELDTLLKDGK